MKPTSDRRAPDLGRECPSAISAELREQVTAALIHRHERRLPDNHRLEVAVATGPAAAAIVVVVGTDRRAHEVFAFARGPGTDLDGPLAAAIDMLDALLPRVVGSDDRFLPLDWEGRPFEGGLVFVRGEVRDYVAEEGAAALLGEPMPPRGTDLLGRE